MDSRLQNIHQTKMHVMSILKYFHPLSEKPDLPGPSSPIKENCAAHSNSCSEREGQ